MANDVRARWTWHLISWLAPASMALIFLLVMLVLAGGFEPFLFIFGAILGITAFVARRFPRRAGPITVLVVLSLLLVMNLPATIEDLGHPESFMNFAVFGVVLLVLGVSAIVASIAQLASRPNDAATWLVNGAVAIMAVAIAGSLVATLSLEDDVAAAGDVRVRAVDIEFEPARISGAGTFGVFLENEDPIRHTFTIEDLDIDVEIPANTDRRVEISAPPGTYEIVCLVQGHENMTGTLTITG